MSQLLLDQGNVTSLDVNRPAQTAVSSGAHTAIVWSLGSFVYEPLTENTTIDNPATPPRDGEVCRFLFLNTASNRTVAWGTKFLFVGTTAPTITVGAHYSFVSFVYLAVADKYIELNRNLNVG